MNEQSETFTFDWFVKSWNDGGFRNKEFLGRLSRYLDIKEGICGSADIKDFPRWILKFLTVLDMGTSLHRELFEERRDIWEKLLVREWKTCLDGKEVRIWWTK